MASKEHIQAIDRVITEGISKDIIHLNASRVQGALLTVNGKPLLNFGSCSYLGLEFDERLIDGACRAIDDFGTQFSASRAYISCGLYDELEELFRQIFQASVMIAPTTTLGHIATIPTIVGDDDAVIVDHQVHASVQNAVQLLKPRGVHVELIRHNRMDMLEDRLAALSEKFQKVWYMADGVYSMYGDKAPLDEIKVLLDKYEQFNFYVDDAHGMSCYGERGQGYVLDHMPIHPRMVVAQSLAKAFATGGSVFVFPTEEMAQLVRNCGGPMITSGPMQPAALGAAVASAKIHLSDQYGGLRDDLHDRIQFTNRLLVKNNLPLVEENDSPVFFIGCGLPKVGYNLISRMKGEGYMTNLGIFPAVPMRNTGLRFTITRLNTEAQIEQMVEDLTLHHAGALKHEGSDIKSLYKAFKMKDKKATDQQVIKDVVLDVSFDIDHVKSLSQVNQNEWDSLHQGKGSHDINGLRLLEESFSNNSKEEDNWDWDFLTIRDNAGRTILSTFFTTTWYKDDMLAPSEVSKQIENERKVKGKYYMCTKTLAMGCPLTVGEHLYIDQSHPQHKAALELMIRKVGEWRESREIQNVLLRDFSENESSLEGSFHENGFVKTDLPKLNTLEIQEEVVDEQTYVQSLSYKSRRHVSREVLKYKDQFTIVKKETSSPKDAKDYFDIYKKLKNEKLELNTFELPFKLFQNIAVDTNWDKIEVIDNDSSSLAAIIFNYKGGDAYNMVFIGVNHEASEYSSYRQAIFNSVLAGVHHGCKKIYMGFTADIEKKHLGCSGSDVHAFAQAEEHFNLQVLDSVNRNSKKKVKA